MFCDYKHSSAINSQYGQAKTVAWRRYGIISEVWFTSALNALFQVKYLEKNSDPVY
jgi:hypothetical protein